MLFRSPNSQSPAQECSSVTVTREGGVPSDPEVHEKRGREGKPPRRRQSRTPGGTERHGKNYHVTTRARHAPAATPDPHRARSRAPTSRTTRALSAPPRARRAGSRPAPRAPGVRVDETTTSREVTPTMLRNLTRPTAPTTRAGTGARAAAVGLASGPLWQPGPPAAPPCAVVQPPRTQRPAPCS